MQGSAGAFTDLADEAVSVEIETGLILAEHGLVTGRDVELNFGDVEAAGPFVLAEPAEGGEGFPD